MVRLKSGLACLVSLGKSPDFLNRLFFWNDKSPDFLDNCISRNFKSKNLTKSSRHTYLKSFFVEIWWNLTKSDDVSDEIWCHVLWCRQHHVDRWLQMRFEKKIPKSLFFGQGLFGKILIVLIFWTRRFFRKCKRPDV